MEVCQQITPTFQIRRKQTVNKSVNILLIALVGQD